MPNDITITHKPKTPAPEPPAKQKKKSSKLSLIIIAILTLAVIALGGILWKMNNDRVQSGVSSQSEQAELVKKVGMLISLPNEKPVIASVEDKEEFKKHPFYKLNQNVEKGDKILMYTKDKKLVLYFYRPSENKITGVSFANVQ